MSTMTFTGTLCVESCPTCHIQHAIPQGMRRWALDHPDNPRGTRDAFWVHCPNGHVWAYVGESDAQKAADRAARAEGEAVRLQAQLDQENAAREHEERRSRALKGHLTRLRNRIALGKCPRCHDEFPDVREHIEVEHPDWAAAHQDALT